jgi:hypothetical protein
MVRRLASGTIATLAGITSSGWSGDGGPATAARLDLPDAVAVDLAGNIFITDRHNSRVRKVTAATGVITTVAGTGEGPVKKQSLHSAGRRIPPCVVAPPQRPAP